MALGRPLCWLPSFSIFGRDIHQSSAAQRSGHTPAQSCFQSPESFRTNQNPSRSSKGMIHSGFRWPHLPTGPWSNLRLFYEGLGAWVASWACLIVWRGVEAPSQPPPLNCSLTWSVRVTVLWPPDLIYFPSWSDCAEEKWFSQRHYSLSRWSGCVPLQHYWLTTRCSDALMDNSWHCASSSAASCWISID